MKGTLFLVVGPSGAGKDTLLAGARERLAAMGRTTIFARRTITRAPVPGGEAHEFLSPAEFAAAAAARAFALAWKAHGFSYGIRRALEQHRRAGIDVVASVSRTVVEEARSRLAPVRVVEVTAPPEVLAARLARRGREAPEAIAQRLARADGVELAGEVQRIVNTGGIGDGVDRLVAILTRSG